MTKAILKENGPGVFLIGTACLLLLMSFGYRSGFGLFVKPITEANGWGREVISLALAIQNLCWGIVAVFAGALADRFGNVKVIVISTVLYALGMYHMAGVWSGTFPKRHMLVIIYLGRAVAISAFLLIPFSLVSVLTFSAVMGFLWLATVPPTSGLVAVMFGTRYMAMLYGVVFFGHQLGSFSGVWLGGWLYDRTGSYGPVWWAGIVLGIVAAIVHWPIRERPVSRLAAGNA